MVFANCWLGARNMKARVAPSSLARFSTRFLFTPYRSNFCASNFYYSWRRFTCLVQSRIFISLRAVWTFAYSTNKHIFFKKEICICGMSLLASGEVNVAADRASVFFFVQSTPSGQFTASAVSSSGQVWTSSCKFTLHMSSVNHRPLICCQKRNTLR